MPRDDVHQVKQSDIHSITEAQPQTSVWEVSAKTFLKQFFLVLQAGTSEDPAIEGLWKSFSVSFLH